MYMYMLCICCCKLCFFVGQAKPYCPRLRADQGCVGPQCEYQHGISKRQTSPCHVDARTTRDRREARREAREWRRSREGVRWGTIAAALIDKYSCCGTTDTPACTQSRA